MADFVLTIYFSTSGRLRADYPSQKTNLRKLAWRRRPYGQEEEPGTQVRSSGIMFRFVSRKVYPGIPYKKY